MKSPRRIWLVGLSALALAAVSGWAITRNTANSNDEGAIEAATSNTQQPSKQIDQTVAGLDIETRNPTADEERRLKLPRSNCVYGQVVERFGQNSPAAAAGLKIGDVILQLDENVIISRDDMRDFVTTAKARSQVMVLVQREQSKESIAVTLSDTDVPAENGFTWEFAGLEQLETAGQEAKRLGTLVLVGLSGSET